MPFWGGRRFLLNWGFPQIGGYLLGGLYNKDYGILGSILGSPYLGKLPIASKREHPRPEAVPGGFRFWVQVLGL